VTNDQLQRVLDPTYLDGLADRTIAELRQMRDDCEGEENRISYARRILQGRIDLVRAEALRREGSGRSSILDVLPDVLADRGVRSENPAQIRMPRRLVPPGDADDILDSGESVDLSGRSTDELRELAADYAREEAGLSDVRRQLFGVLDRLQAEIAERYRTGAASIGELFADD
jgi:hypothetical protein